MSNLVLTNGKKSLNGTKRILLLVGLAIAAALPAQAADYVFMYNGGYLAVNNSGAVVSTTTFSRSCVWTCVSNTTTLTAATLSGTSTWLYTEANGKRYWLVGSNSDGTSVTVQEAAPGTARWRSDGTYLFHRQSNNYYLYYRGGSWKTSRRNNGNSYGENAYMSGNGSGTDYRSTTSTVTTNNVDEAVIGSLSTPTITPNEAQSVEYNGSVSYNASATGPTRIVPAHTTYTHNSNTIYYYNNQTHTSTDAFAINNPEVTYTWTLSGDGASALELMSTTGENTIVKYTGSATGTTATLTVTARVGTETRTASVTINVTPVEPTAISATGTTVYMGNSGEVVYTLTPNYAYNRVAAVSGNSDIFTVSSPATSGAVAITPVAPGQATLTLTALNSNGSNGPSVVDTVIVRDICAVPQFAFAQSGSSVLATITTTTPGATIRYITDGTDPTPTTGTVYSSAPFTVADGTNIKAIAVKDGYYDPSAVATKVVRPIDYVEQGVSGGIVTLNDLEDHTWTYYSGVSSDLDGGNYNTNYLGKLYSPNPRNVKITYKANGGAVSIDESDTQFVYYKTLEESATTGEYAYQVISNPFSKRPNGKGFGGWKIKDGADYIKGYNDEATLPLDAEIVFNNLPYASTNCVSAEIVFEATWVDLNNITYASGNTITYNVSGGNYETNILVLNRNVTGTITTSSPVTIMMVEPNGSSDYRDTYTFTGNITPDNNGVTKIEFTRWNSQNTVDADYNNLWIGRGMTTTSRCANLITGVNGTGSVASPQYSIKVESGVYQYFDFYKGHSTYTGGTENTGFTVSGSSANARITIGNDYDRASGTNTNLEFIYGPMFGYSGNFSTRGNRDNLHTLDLVVKSGSIGTTFFMENTNTATYLQGGAGYCMYLSSAGSQTNVGGRNVVIEGGDICSIGGGVDSYNNAPSNNNTPSTTTHYDRMALNIRIKGGTIHGNVYGGAAKSPSGGNKIIVMTGGQVKGWLAAGCNGTDNDGGQNYGTSYVYIGGKGAVDSDGSTKVLGYANGGNVYAAGAGRQGATTCGEMTFGSNLVIADDSYIERGIYGGGNYGYAKQNTSIYIMGGVNEGLAGTVNTVTTEGGLYGGANQQDGPDVHIYMNGGEMRGGVYGGCNTSGSIDGDVTMHIDGGQVGTTTQAANIHGGGYGQATRVLGSVNLTLGKADCSTIADGVTVYGDVYGGSAEGRTNGNNGLTSGAVTNVNLYHGTIYGALYGGGLGTKTPDHPAIVYGPVAVKVYGGSVRTNDGSGENGSGGVFGCNNVNGAPQGNVTVDIYGTDSAEAGHEFALYAVYGGGNRSDYDRTPVVTIHGCKNHIEYVYGGGNASAVRGTDVTIWGGHIGNAFGGGNGFSVTGNHTDASADHYNPGANITADGTNLTIHGGTIDAAFGGSNQWGYINSTITVTVEEQTESANDPCTGSAYKPCDNLIVELYGGGNQAPAVTREDAYISPDVNINSCNMEITNLFGGAKNANHGANINLEVTKGKFENVFGGNNLGGTITGNVTLTLKGGTMTNAFGGNNMGGSITGTITVLVDSTGECPLKVDNVYGGGNQAAYAPNDPTAATPTVNFVNGTVRNAVFGGGLGDAAKITANPTVNIGGTGSKHAVVGGTRINGTKGDGNVYGGGSQADVLKDGAGTGNTSVTLSGHATVKGNVYGGGNEANVEGNSSVKLEE
ncbi:MAG: chitobiase/beta-hexosaminidase C-terminal domain-containing protein [Bacteroidales bacterium]|nr:chitobiase/beta-hexosaminidase C-terminal domain-containing protein [Bacteroidales bacterium]